MCLARGREREKPARATIQILNGGATTQQTDKPLPWSRVPFCRRGVPAQLLSKTLIPWTLGKVKPVLRGIPSPYSPLFRKVLLQRRGRVLPGCRGEVCQSSAEKETGWKAGREEVGTAWGQWECWAPRRSGGCWLRGTAPPGSRASEFGDRNDHEIIFCDLR